MCEVVVSLLWVCHEGWRWVRRRGDDVSVINVSPHGGFAPRSGEPGNPSIPIRFYYRIRELNL
jgi:hypothetical protein